MTRISFTTNELIDITVDRVRVYTYTYALRGTSEQVLVADLAEIGLVRLSLEQIGDRSLGTKTMDGLQCLVALAAQRPRHVAEVTALG